MSILDQLRRGADTARAKADQMLRINRVQGEIKSIHREIQAQREKIADGVIELHLGAGATHVSKNLAGAQAGQPEQQGDAVRKLGIPLATAG